MQYLSLSALSTLNGFQVYYNYFTNFAYRGAAKGKEITVPSALDQLPLFLRGGSILATRERPRRASSLMQRDPFTLKIALSKSGTARGELYLDDGVSYNHTQGDLIWREFSAKEHGKHGLRISSADLAAVKPDEAVDGVSLAAYNPANNFVKSVSEVRVEKVVILGLRNKPRSVKVQGGGDLVFKYTPGVAFSDKQGGSPSILEIKDPKVLIKEDWSILVD